MAVSTSFYGEYCLLPWRISGQEIILKATLKLRDNVESEDYSEWAVAGN